MRLAQEEKKNMVKIIMHGCNGAMGRTITGLAKEMDGIEIVAGIDVTRCCVKDYPVFASLEECNVEAEIVDFASAKAGGPSVRLLRRSQDAVSTLHHRTFPEQIEK